MLAREELKNITAGGEESRPSANSGQDEYGTQQSSSVGQNQDDSGDVDGPPPKMTFRIFDAALAPPHEEMNHAPVVRTSRGLPDSQDGAAFNMSNETTATSFANASTSESRNANESSFLFVSNMSSSNKNTTTERGRNVFGTVAENGTSVKKINEQAVPPASRRREDLAMGGGGSGHGNHLVFTSASTYGAYGSGAAQNLGQGEKDANATDESDSSLTLAFLLELELLSGLLGDCCLRYSNPENRQPFFSALTEAGQQARSTACSVVEEEHLPGPLIIAASDTTSTTNSNHDENEASAAEEENSASSAEEGQSGTAAADSVVPASSPANGTTEVGSGPPLGTSLNQADTTGSNKTEAATASNEIDTVTANRTPDTEAADHQTAITAESTHQTLSTETVTEAASAAEGPSQADPHTGGGEADPATSEADTGSNETQSMQTSSMLESGYHGQQSFGVSSRQARSATKGFHFAPVMGATSTAERSGLVVQSCSAGKKELTGRLKKFSKLLAEQHGVTADQLQRWLKRPGLQKLEGLAKVWSHPDFLSEDDKNAVLEIAGDILHAYESGRFATNLASFVVTCFLTAGLALFAAFALPKVTLHFHNVNV
ncbi:unnamed protein product [Amoebophrya sp. A120]|nr:unnamed protein product [Amoebophrya sp. A120]|eukprot:GSA120T00005381001.1